jgi:hypothetical protein
MRWALQNRRFALACDGVMAGRDRFDRPEAKQKEPQGTKKGRILDKQHPRPQRTKGFLKATSKCRNSQL